MAAQFKFRFHVVAILWSLMTVISCTPNQNQKTEGATAQEGVSGNPTIAAQQTASTSKNTVVTQKSPATTASSGGGTSGSSTPPTAQISTVNSTVAVNSATVASGSMITITVTAKDSSGSNLTSGVTAQITVAGGTSTGTLSAVTNNFDGTFTATFTAILSGTPLTVSAALNGYAITSTLPTITVTPGSPVSIFVTGPSTGYTKRCVGPFTATFKDVAGNVAPLSSSKTINFVDTLGGAFYASADCSGVSVASIAAVASNSSKTFSMLPSWTAGSSTVTVADSVAVLTAGTIDVSVSSSIGMVGVTGTNGFSNASGIAARSRYDGAFSGVTGVALDGSGNLYISEYSSAAPITSAKVSKWNIVGQSEVGWIGAVSSGLLATGGAVGCTSASNAKTPGWCNGGWSLSSTTVADIFTQPQRVYVAGGYAYVSDTNRHRVMKFDASTGAFVGWVGRINTTAATGGVGCNTGVTGVATAAWCTGGNSTSGTGNGMLNTPRGLFGDGTYLYVADAGNHRIVRYDMATGAFAGWVGRLSTPSTVLFNTCAAKTTAGAVTCWSSGGVAGAGALNGEFSAPNDVWIDGSTMYVADTSNHRIQKFTLSGVSVASAGWMGVRNATPGGTCTGVSANLFTNKWCNGTGGSPLATNTDGAMSSPASVWGDSTHLYVADTNNHRVNRYTKATAVATGWLGLVRTSPGGGDPGCASTMPFAATPGWCTGGLSAAGHGIGMFSSPQEVIGDGTNLYVADHGNNRVLVINASSGVASGFIGAQSQQHTGWASGASLLNATSASAGSYDDAAVDASYGIASDGTDIYYTEYYGHRVKKLSKSSGTAVGWVGRTLMPPSGGAAGCSTTAPTALAQNWCLGGSASSGNIEGQFNNPGGVYLSNNYVYVSDYNNNRIVRYTKDGAAAGWIGLIGTSPTGGDINCAGASAGTYTLGWCVGGTASAATATVGFKNPMGITGDGTYLYITESSIGRIQKVRMSDGTQMGWIGKLSAVPAPTGGAAGCTAVAANGATPGWCTGGNIAVSGTGDNMFNSPLSVFHDSGYLYVADYSNHRIARVDAATGATGGWIGRSGASAAVCPVGFSGVANGTNPTWCTGGTPASSGSATGQFNGPRGVWTDGTSIYVADSVNARIQKIKQSDGTFVGWFGRVSAGTLSGPAGCGATTAGMVTPNWCAGGTARVGPMLGAFDAPAVITGDANWIYVTDLTQNRVVRIKP